MDSQSTIDEDSTFVADDLSCDEKDVVKWIIDMPISRQDQAARTHLQTLLCAASQPRHESGNTCIKLCYFVQLSRKSTAESLKAFAFSSLTSLDLFSFYVEWNEKNQHRSMRQVIELLATLISANPDKAEAQSIRAQILQRLISIISHRSAQPLVKPGFKAMECLMSKGTFSAAEVLEAYRDTFKYHRGVQGPAPGPHVDDSTARDSFVGEIFDWMSLPDTAPAAGKLLVTFFQNLRKVSVIGPTGVPEAHTFLWQRWIHEGLAKYPDSLENIKNYLFPPLFKLDRAGSLEFLQELSQSIVAATFGNQEIDIQALLILSAMDVGKKLGLVDEMDFSNPHSSRSKDREFVILPEKDIGDLLSHNLGTVRSLAFSVLVSSISSIRPFSLEILSLLQKNLDILHADTDARFRNEVLSNSKHMIERFRGAIAYLTRESRDLALSKKENSTGLITLLSSHKDFLEWYLRFLFAELVPTASYQRHITALKALEELAKSGYLVTTKIKRSLGTKLSQSAWPFTIALGPSDLYLLLDLLMDPFEDVRASACLLLKLAPHESFDDLQIPDAKEARPQWLVPVRDGNRYNCNGNLVAFFFNEDKHNVTYSHNSRELGMLLNFIKVAEDASNRSGRADLADGVARSYELLSNLMPDDHSRYCLVDALTTGLEQKVAQAKLNLAEAVTTAPIHGQFASLRLVWGTILKNLDNSPMAGVPSLKGTKFVAQSMDWNKLQSRIVVCCEDIWTHVEHVLCNDSPEGSLLEDLEDMESIDTKDVLSYSFRAVHESSNLLRAIVNKLLPKAAGGAHLLPYELFLRAGNLTFAQLSDLRHRGAFSTVSLTFAHCCQLTQTYGSKDGQAKTLLQTWYQDALSCVFEQVSTTRRSAGIPALMTGILSANSKAPSFDEILSKLKNVAQEPSALSEEDVVALPQVHAMNCLKEIFKSSVLGKRCENHISECLEIAADSLNSKIWAIRNCGLLLLRSLIDCLFGTSESKLVTETGWDGRSTKLSYERYPRLPELLIRLLNAEPEIQSSSGLTAISAVQSVFPALDIIRRAGPPAGRQEEFFFLVARHLGSKAWHMRDIAARTICTLLLHESWLAEVLQLLKRYDGSANWLHGVLLSIKYILERRLELDPETASEGISALMEQLPTPIKTCPMLDAAFDDVKNVCLRILPIDSSYVQMFNFADDDGSERVSTFESPLRYDAKNALLRKTEALCCLNWSTRTGRLDVLRRNLVISAQHDVDTALIFLDKIPHELKTKDPSPYNLTGFRDIYLAVLVATESEEVRGVALRDLAIDFQRMQDQTIVHKKNSQITKLLQQQRQATEEPVDEQTSQMNTQNCVTPQDTQNARVNPSEKWASLTDADMPVISRKLAEMNDVNLATQQAQQSSLPQISRMPLPKLQWMLEPSAAPRMIQGPPNDEASFNLLEISRPSRRMNGGPELSNADIRITGLILLQESLLTPVWLPNGTFAGRMEAWGEMLSDMLQPKNDFNTRYAAVMALGTFYRVFHRKIPNHPAKTCFLHSLLGLYDALNDDSDEIRDIGASIVSELIGGCHVPMAAGREMLQWCLSIFDDTASFRMAVQKRVTGTQGLLSDLLWPAADQLRLALKSNDSLFVEEEYNLYVDHVAENSLWSLLFADLSDQSWDHSAIHLSTWALKGLSELQDIMSVQNYGWTSIPKAFTVFMRIVIVSKTVLSRRVNNKERYGAQDAFSQLVDNTANLLEEGLASLYHQGIVLRIHPLLLAQLRPR